MNSFVNAVKNETVRTENNMKAFANTSNACIDLFYNIGAMRGQDVTPKFVAAYVENPTLALRIAAWARDVRGGAGERQAYRTILKYLEETDRSHAYALMVKAPELGRWDDMFVVTDSELKELMFHIVSKTIAEGHAVLNKPSKRPEDMEKLSKAMTLAKWMPREKSAKKALALEFINYFDISARRYRKVLTDLTDVVENHMCAQDWHGIDFSHVPSLAHSRYKKAFNRNTPAYKAYVEALVCGDRGVKVNAGAVYPHDVLKGRISSNAVYMDKTELDLVMKQWEALPNYIGSGSVLALVDVSGSMTSHEGTNSCSNLEIAVSLGLYVADKNRGAFKDTFLTFSGRPELLHLKGNIGEKIAQMRSSRWGMNTNLHAAFEKILETAVEANVPEADMPETLVIFSDMQFDQCVKYDDSAMQMIRRKYNDAGYNLPKVVFWNLAARANVPVKFDTRGVALVSGYSPAVMTAILAGKDFTPYGIMLQAVMKDKYDVIG